MTKKTLSVHYDELGKTLGETLLTPTKIYVKAVMSLLDSVKVKAISHITGGGFYENIPRMLKEGTHAVVEKRQLPDSTNLCKTCKRGRNRRADDVQHIQHGTWNGSRC